MPRIARIFVVFAAIMVWNAATAAAIAANVRTQQPRQTATPKPAQDPAAEIASLRSDVKALRAQLAELDKRLKTMTSRSLRLQFDVSDLKNRNLTVSLDPAVPKQFQRLDSSSGFFIVSLQEVVPYLDGFRVTLHVGNLTSARYAGFKLNATWGPRYDWYTEESYNKWESQKQTKEFSYTDVLLPGNWNKVDLLLPTTGPTQLGFIEVSIGTNLVSLSSN